MGRERQNLVGCALGVGKASPKVPGCGGRCGGRFCPGRTPSTEGDTLVLREARSASCKEMSAGGRESRGTHTKMGREQEDCRGEEGSEEREEASGRAGAWEGDLGLGFRERQAFRLKWRRRVVRKREKEEQEEEDHTRIT